MKFTQRSLFVLFVTFSPVSIQNLYGHFTTPPTQATTASTDYHELPEITDPKDLDNIVSNRQPTVIAGYMHHCSNCTRFMKYFATLQKKYPQVTFLTVNGPKLKLHEQVAKRSGFKIPGYPSIVLITKGMIKDVQIGGNEKALEEKIKKLLK